MARLLRAVTPPVILDAARAALGRQLFRGQFSSWADARRRSSGYDSDSILEKVKRASLAVKRGDAACERDSVLFETPQYPLPLLAVLLRAASQAGGDLRVLDFGGALGSSYYQCRDFLSGLRRVSWCVVEQPKFVAAGKEAFEDGIVRFYPSVSACAEDGPPDVALFSGVLQYLEKPFDVLQEIGSLAIQYLVVDRTPFLDGGSSRLCVQVVPAALYRASYPAWLFAADSFRTALEPHFRLLAEFDAVDGTVSHGAGQVRFKGMVFEKRPRASATGV